MSGNAPDFSKAGKAAMAAKAAKSANATRQDLTISARQEILRTVIGKTSRSPFLWSLDRQQKTECQLLIKKMHQSFWSAKEKSGIGLGDDSDLNSVASGAEANACEQQLLRIAAEVYGFSLPVGIADHAELEGSSPLMQQLAGVEFELWTAMLDSAGEDAPTDQVQVAQVARERFEALVRDLLDQDGWIEGFAIKDWGLLAASWCRSHQLLRAMHIQVDGETELQLTEMVEQLLRNSRSDGSLLHNAKGTGLNGNAFRKAVSRQWANGFSRKVLSDELQPSTRAPATTSVSEWAQVGVIRRDWKPSSAKVGFTFDQHRVGLDIDNGQTLCIGDCSPQIKINGEVVNPSDEIGVSCRLRFDEAEYVELEIEYDEWKLQRQILLFTDDLLLYIADNLVGKEAGNIEYRCEYPLGPEQQIVRETETNEFYLKNGDRYCLVLPLSFPEWKTENRSQEFKFEEDRFAVEQQVSGLGMSVPLIVDLSPKRSMQPRTWRRLTVAEQMQTVGSDIAVAYRVQIGKQQWLFYRTLAEPESRTFLGQNLDDDFYVERIDLEGTIESILEIE